MFDNPLLKATFEKNKSYLERRLKLIQEFNRDVEQIEASLKGLSTPANQKDIEGLGIIKWDGKNLKLDKKLLIKCTEDTKLKVSPYLIEFLEFVLKGER